MRQATRAKRSRSGAQAVFKRLSIGAVALGALAVGATAIGALAIGALVVPFGNSLTLRTVMRRPRMRTRAAHARRGERGAGRDRGG
jgi:hypothetical protein